MLYDIAHSQLKKVHTTMVTMTDDDVKVEPVESHKYLFTTSTCPNCNRMLYDIAHSQLKKVHTTMVTMTDDDVKVEPVESHKYLFTTSTCPNCKMANHD